MAQQLFSWNSFRLSLNFIFGENFVVSAVMVKAAYYNYTYDFLPHGGANTLIDRRLVSWWVSSIEEYTLKLAYNGRG